MKRFVSNIVVFLFAVLPAQMSAETSDTHYLTSGVHQELRDGNLYQIPFEEIILDFHEGESVSPISLAPGTVASVELRKGQKLIVTGSNSKNIFSTPIRMGQAYPGILLPEGATLLIFGDGEVIARGGAGGDGEVGHNGGSAELSAKRATGGYGGKGGIGGGGSAPGIGGIGGIGGLGVAGVSPSAVSNPDLDEDYDKNPTNGVDNPHKGGNGSGMGTLILLGNIKVTSIAGAPGNFVIRYGLHGCNDEYRERHFVLTNMFKAGYGGAGGNGGSGGSAKYGIGGGAPGAGGGGGGGAGGFMSRGTFSYDEMRFLTGVGGLGGESSNASVSGRHGEGESYKSAYKAGKGGGCGAFGGNGTLLYSPTVMMDFTYDVQCAEEITSFAQLPEKTLKFITRTMTGAVWENGEDQQNLYYSQIMPSAKVVVPVDDAKGTFQGYYDQYGKIVYDETGSLAIKAEDHSVNFTFDPGPSQFIVTANDNITLTPKWSGLKDVYVVRYMENPNFEGNPADPARYYSTDSIVAEHITIPYSSTEVKLPVSLYKNAKGEELIDRDLYSFVGGAVQDTTVTIHGEENSITVELFYNNRTFNLTWESLDEEMMSRQCTNIKEYTKAGSISFGKAIIYPLFRQIEGRTFDHWEYQVSGSAGSPQVGKYEIFTGEAMPKHDVTLRPVFDEMTFKAETYKNSGGKVEVYTKAQGSKSESLSESLSEIKYHTTVFIKAICDDKYRVKSLEVHGASSGTHVETNMENDLFSFLMPDEDVTINVEFEYHPFCRLAAIKATENGVGKENIVYCATKDWKTYYTDDNDFYSFDESQYGGRISEMSYSVGDHINIRTDFKGDNGSRQGRVFIIRNTDNNGVMLEEVANRQIGTADSTVIFFPIDVDSLMTRSDIPLQLQWSIPRTKFRINYVSDNRVKVSSIYANGRSIIGTNIAYMDEQIDFKIQTADTTFNQENISLEYETGYDYGTLTTGVNTEIENDTIYNFIMPEGDVYLTFKFGVKYRVINDIEQTGVAIYAPANAVAGYPVRCIIKYNTDYVDVPDDKDIHLFVNGTESTYDDCSVIVNPSVSLYSEDMYAPSNICTKSKMFIMPEADAYLSLNDGYDPSGIRQVADRESKPSVQGIYTVSGQKVSSTDYLPDGIYIINGKKYIRNGK